MMARDTHREIRTYEEFHKHQEHCIFLVLIILNKEFFLSFNRTCISINNFIIFCCENCSELSISIECFFLDAVGPKTHQGYADKQNTARVSTYTECKHHVLFKSGHNPLENM